MTEPLDPAIQQLLAQARAQFAAALPAKIAELEAQAGRGAWDEVRRAAHKLRGSCGTYGFEPLGEAAGALEDLLLDAGAAPGEPALTRIGELVTFMKADAVVAAASTS